MAPSSDMHSKCPDLVDGTFVHVINQDFADYLIKIGTSAEEAKGYVGSTWTMTIRKLEGRRVLFVLVSPEYPQFSGIDTLAEDTDLPTDQPMLGGKAVMRFVQRDDTGYDCQAKSDKAGSIVWTETYSQEGVVFDITAKDKGANVKQVWQRQVNEEGWFKFEKEENMPAFCKATCVSTEYTNQYRCGIRKHGDQFTLTDMWGTNKVEFTYKLGEERHYYFEGPPVFDRKITTTRLGPGKFKVIAKPPNDDFIEEWIQTISEDGIFYEVHELKSGVKATMFLRRYTNIEGEYKLTSVSGMEEYTSLIGLPSSVASSLASDSSFKMVISEREGYVYVRHESEIMPTRQTVFRYDEEFDYDQPGISDKFRAVMSMQGNTQVGVFKGPRFTLTNATTFTDNFAIVSSTIAGTGVSMKMIYEKVH